MILLIMIIIGILAIIDLIILYKIWSDEDE